MDLAGVAAANVGSPRRASATGEEILDTGQGHSGELTGVSTPPEAVLETVEEDVYRPGSDTSSKLTDRLKKAGTLQRFKASG